MTDWLWAPLFRKPRMAWTMMKSGRIAARPPRPGLWHHDRLDRFADQALRNNWEWTYAPQSIGETAMTSAERQPSFACSVARYPVATDPAIGQG